MRDSRSIRNNTWAYVIVSAILAIIFWMWPAPANAQEAQSVMQTLAGQTVAIGDVGQEEEFVSADERVAMQYDREWCAGLGPYELQNPYTRALCQAASDAEQYRVLGVALRGRFLRRMEESGLRVVPSWNARYVLRATHDIAVGQITESGFDGYFVGTGMQVAGLAVSGRYGYYGYGRGLDKRDVIGISLQAGGALVSSLFTRHQDQRSYVLVDVWVEDTQTGEVVWSTSRYLEVDSRKVSIRTFGGSYRYGFRDPYGAEFAQKVVDEVFGPSADNDTLNR